MRASEHLPHSTGTNIVPCFQLCLELFFILSAHVSYSSGRCVTHATEEIFAKLFSLFWVVKTPPTTFFPSPFATNNHKKVHCLDWVVCQEVRIPLDGNIWWLGCFLNIIFCSSFSNLPFTFCLLGQNIAHHPVCLLPITASQNFLGNWIAHSSWWLS